jgi:transposase
MVARQFGITQAQTNGKRPTCKAMLVAVGANETVVPASEPQEAMRRIKHLEGGCVSAAVRPRNSNPFF